MWGYEGRKKNRSSRIVDDSRRERRVGRNKVRRVRNVGGWEARRIEMYEGRIGGRKVAG